MEDGEERLVVPSSLGEQLGILFYIALFVLLAMGFIKLSFLGGNRDWPIYSLPWWIFVTVLSMVVALLSFWFVVVAADLIRFGETNAALTIDENGIFLPFRDANSIITWENVQTYERKKYQTRSNGLMWGLYVTLRKVNISWRNHLKISRIKVLECRVDNDDAIDMAESLIDRYYVWK